MRKHLIMRLPDGRCAQRLSPRRKTSHWTERKKYDEAFRLYWDCHNLKQNCIYLTEEFGWIVDDHSLGTNLNRHR